MFCMYLVKTVAQYTNKCFQKSLVGVNILREEVEKDVALNTAALFPPWGGGMNDMVLSCSREYNDYAPNNITEKIISMKITAINQ